MLVSDRPHWHAEAQCHGHTMLMYPTRHAKTVEDARALCASCPVQEPCLEYALANRETFGVWGGTSERQRRRLRRQRNANRITDAARRPMTELDDAPELEHDAPGGGVAPRQGAGRGSKGAARSRRDEFPLHIGEVQRMNDDHELEGADLLGDMTPASFHAPDDWWRQTIAGLDETARAKLLDGELSIVVMNGRGVEKVRLEPPEWVRGELGRAG